jgi:hypothetical protein
VVRFVNTIIFGVFFANTVFCQNDVLGKSIQEKSFHSLGTSVYLDIFNGPIREVKNTLTVTDPFGNTTTTTTFDYTRVSGYSYFTLIYHYRYNIREMGSDASFGISTLPSLGLFAGQSLPVSSFGSIPVSFSGCMNLPVMAGFHFGTLATNTSRSTMGASLCAGYEYNMAPMFYVKNATNRDIKTSWLNPCISLGVRYEGNSAFGDVQEINLKVGFGLVGKDLKGPNNLNNNSFLFLAPVTIRLAYFTYLNN